MKNKYISSPKEEMYTIEEEENPTYNLTTKRTEKISL